MDVDEGTKRGQTCAQTKRGIILNILQTGAISTIETTPLPILYLKLIFADKLIVKT